MASSRDRQQQKSRERKRGRDQARRARRKEIRARRTGVVSGANERVDLSEAAGWPVQDCMISFDWQEGERPTADLVLSRRHDDGRVAAAFFALNIGCLGIKRASGKVPISGQRYLRTLEEMSERSPMMDLSPDDALKILRGVQAWGERFGFSAPAEIEALIALFGDADPSRSRIGVECGRSGAPFYVPEDGDDEAAIRAKLELIDGDSGFFV